MTRGLSSSLYADETLCVERLLAALPWDAKKAKRVEKDATALVRHVRKAKRKAGAMESFLQHYALSTQEGIALMCLAEALLRVPDSKTRDALIRDKVVAAKWLDGAGGSKDWLVMAAGVGLSLTGKTLESLLARLGEPVIREAMLRAMKVLGQNFVLGRDIEEACKNAKPFEKIGYRMSYDMLGEGARTREDAHQYFAAYEHAIEQAAKRAKPGQRRKPGVSVKLSALHPRYEVAQKETMLPEMIAQVKTLSRLAMKLDVPMTIDAEESERLEISLDVIEAVLSDKEFEGWDGFGMAVQAYQKRALPLVEYLAVLLKKKNRKMQIRLVKGAYWDSEVKRAQELGLSDYPVFTRKHNSDLSYMACAYVMFQAKDHIYPMLATHNAQSVAAIMRMAKDAGAEFEFQRLHGMGEALHDHVLQASGIPVSVYAPVGPHRDLLAYLVRRLLENGANSSFVNRLLDKDVRAKELARDPVVEARDAANKRHPGIAMPADIYGPERKNAAGLDLDDKDTASALLRGMKRHKKSYEVHSLIGGKAQDGHTSDVINPAKHDDVLGQVLNADSACVDDAFDTARGGFETWSNTPAQTRADVLMRIADLMEERRNELMALCVREAGKTIPDALAELREAIDFCRYYAVRGCSEFDERGQGLPGPTGESNRLFLQARGIFVCVSPWNFPLAIFTGQIVAALMAGNSVIAKPAEQTPIIAMRTVQLMHKAGVPKDALNLLLGDGKLGATITAHKDVAGVAFTGSTATAKRIQLTLAKKDGPIVPLIAETGGQNAMIVDSSALPEQVVDDVVLSAFGSAGQRCSALRVLYLQDDVADGIIDMLRGAMAELNMGDPVLLSTDIGPVIDKTALSSLAKHRKALEKIGTFIAEVELPSEFKKAGHYIAPCAFEISSMDILEKENFGPILHIIRYKASELDDVLAQINDSGFGLTLGVHSRIDSFRDHVVAHARVGNAYVNRGMTGAVVGVQPFGGMGLSGTGPKAGGPHYLHAFSTEKVVSIDTTASGGNTHLMTMED